MLVYLLEPVGDVVVGVFTGTIVHQQYALSALVIRLRDGAEPFLASGVPNLKFNVLAINIEILYLEIDP